MQINNDLNKILEDFKKAESLNSLNKEDLLNKRKNAVENLDILTIKEIDNKLNNFNNNVEN